MAENTDKIEKKGSLSARTTVYATDKLKSVRDGNRKSGDPITVHPVRAEAMLKDGKVTKTPPGKK